MVDVSGTLLIFGFLDIFKLRETGGISVHPFRGVFSGVPLPLPPFVGRRSRDHVAQRLFAVPAGQRPRLATDGREVEGGEHAIRSNGSFVFSGVVRL